MSAASCSSTIKMPAMSLWVVRSFSPNRRRMLNRAIARETRAETSLSSDHDPLLRFQGWLANLRIHEVDEIKSIPGTFRPHAFIERSIGTNRREYLDQTRFWEPSRH
jgi:hypothetical protein